MSDWIRSLLIVHYDMSTAKALAGLVVKEHDVYVYLANVGARVKEFLQNIDIDLVIASQELPDMTGMALFSELSQSHPDVVRVLLVSSEEDVESAVAGGNGLIYRYIREPIGSSAFMERLNESIRGDFSGLKTVKEAPEFGDMPRAGSSLDVREREEETDALAGKLEGLSEGAGFTLPVEGPAEALDGGDIFEKTDDEGRGLEEAPQSDLLMEEDNGFRESVTVHDATTGEVGQEVPQPLDFRDEENDAAVQGEGAGPHMAVPMPAALSVDAALESAEGESAPLNERALTNEIERLLEAIAQLRSDTAAMEVLREENNRLIQENRRIREEKELVAQQSARMRDEMESFRRELAAARQKMIHPTAQANIDPPPLKVEHFHRQIGPLEIYDKAAEWYQQLCRAQQLNGVLELRLLSREQELSVLSEEQERVRQRLIAEQKRFQKELRECHESCLVFKSEMDSQESRCKELERARLELSRKLTWVQTEWDQLFNPQERKK